jgi:hypothetical protein
VELDPIIMVFIDFIEILYGIVLDNQIIRSSNDTVPGEILNPVMFN